jgi:hypothetical protein
MPLLAAAGPSLVRATLLHLPCQSCAVAAVASLQVNLPLSCVISDSAHSGLRWRRPRSIVRTSCLTNGEAESRGTDQLPPSHVVFTHYFDSRVGSG